MSDPKKAAEQAQRRALQAAERAEAARERAEQLKQRQQGDASSLDGAEREAATAGLPEDRARESARTAHKEAADFFEERAVDLRAVGDEQAARESHERADDAREREEHT